MAEGQADILLDGNPYVLREISRDLLVKREQMPIFPPTQTISPDRVARNSLTPIWGQDDFSGGLGLATAGVLDPSNRNRFWWSTLRTRGRRYGELGMLNEAVTHAAEADHIVGYQEFRGDFWGVFEDDFSAAEETGLFIRVYGATLDNFTGGTSWLNPAGIAAAWGHRLFHVFAHKNEVWMIGSGGITANLEDTYTIQSTPTPTTAPTARDGATFVQSRFLTTTVTRRNNWEDAFHARGLDFGNNVVVALYQDPAAFAAGNSQIRIGYDSASGTNWTFNAGLIIPSGYGPRGLHSWRDRAGTLSPVLITAEAVYALNITNNTYTEIHRLPGAGDANNGLGSCVGGDGKLYISLGSGDIIRLSLGVAVGSDQYELKVENVGPATHAAGKPSDGLPTAYRGYAKFIWPGPTGIYVAYGGQAASKNASILFMDYESQAWHVEYAHATANEDLFVLGASAEDDSVDKLHAGVEGADASTMYVFREPENPHWISARKTRTSGILQLPHLHFDADGLAKAVRRILARADDLSADTTGEYIGVKYGVDGAVHTTTTLGNFLSGTKQLDIASGAGVAVTDIGFELTLNRDGGDNTQSPKLASINIFYNVARGELEAWEFVIDVAETARMVKKNRETVISDIETTRNKAVSVTFQDSRLAAAIYVDVLIPQWLDNYPMDIISSTKPERQSYAKIRVERRMA